MLVEHLRSLPLLKYGISAYDCPEYVRVNCILVQLFRAKYPEWTAKTRTGVGMPNVPQGLIELALDVSERYFRHNLFSTARGSSRMKGDRRKSEPF